jgi:DNA-binding transcriptional LysR family regulator
MDIKPADLPLLVALNALLDENNVTRAAARLHVSQPALSAQLARLRELFGDPLLVPSESGRGMVPTARAEQLKAPLQEALRQLGAALNEPVVFDPATAERTFVVAGNDNALTMFGLELVRQVAQSNGAGLRVAFREPDVAAVVAQMERGETDLLLAAARSIPGALKSVPICKERYYMAQRKKHPRGAAAPTLKQYCALGHVLVSGRGEFRSNIDEQLQALKCTRHVAVAVPHYNLVPAIVANSDYICTLPIRFLQRFAGYLDIFPLPFALPEFAMSMAWHPRSDNDPAHRWLRSQLKPIDA